MSDSEASSCVPTPTLTTYSPNDKRWTIDLNFPKKFAQMQRQPTSFHHSGGSIKSTTAGHKLTSTSSFSSPIGAKGSLQDPTRDTESIQGSPKVGSISRSNTNESPINRFFKNIHHTAISTGSGSGSPTMAMASGSGESGEGTSAMSRSSSLTKKSALVEEKKKEYLDYQN
ncbi:hypothetical protein I204_06384 [Kwoniella mangroviensis CBS 8886]|nr:hypothetical protein I204_06384 [Kwoniella mangroviensis CBS 8886]